MNRWWIYQRERFPLAAYGLLAVTTGVSATTHSSLLRGQFAFPGAATLLAASLSALALFMQMRVADEFKDRADDAQWRPYRPVPRGLVRLSELGAIGLAAAALQLAIAFAFGTPMLVPLLLTWAYFALTLVEFGAANWLKARPLAYLLSHLPLASLIVLHLSSFDWMRDRTSAPPAGLGTLLATAFASALLLEVGRKLRAPGDEEPGVVTYSAAWGVRRAVAVWAAALVALVAAAACAAARVGAGPPFAAAALLLLVAGIGVARRFVAAPNATRASRLDAVARVATLLAYLGLGPGALVWAWYAL